MDVVELTEEFVSHNSVSTRSNTSVSRAIARQMRAAGLTVERLRYRDPNHVLKICLVGKKGQGPGGLALMGHSDVVPAEGWAWDAFKTVQKKGRLYGRGTADMKGAIACMVGFSILYTGIILIKESSAGLMDRAEPALLQEISSLLEKHRKDNWVGIHELRTFRSGSIVNVSLHLMTCRSRRYQVHKG